MESSKFIRHTLHRTVVKKTATQDCYINNDDLIMSLFNKNQNDLDLMRNNFPGQKFKFKIYLREDYFNPNKRSFDLYYKWYPKSNGSGEWRLPGLGDVIKELHITETDELIFEVVQKNNNPAIYYINKLWKPDTLIINSCSKKNCAQLNQRFSKSHTSRSSWNWVYNNRCVYWVWDFYATKDDPQTTDKIWDNFLDKQVKGYYVENNIIKCVTIEISNLDIGTIKNGPRNNTKSKNIYSLIVKEDNSNNEIILNNELYILEKLGTELIIRPRDKENKILQEFITTRP